MAASTHAGPIASSSSPPSPPSHFTATLHSLFRSPHPGCLFLHAAATYDHAAALAQLRAFFRASTGALHWAELHPHLMGGTVPDVQRDIEDAFGGAPPELGTGPSSSSSAGKAMRSAIDIFPRTTYTSGGGGAPRILIVPSAHLLRTTRPPLIWSQLLRPPRTAGYAVVLLSALPLERWATPDGVESPSGCSPFLSLSFANGDVLTGSRLLTGASSGLSAGAPAPALEPAHLPASAPEEQAPLYWRSKLRRAAARFKPAFVSYVSAALAAEVGHAEGEELRLIGVALWLKLGRVVLARGRDEYGLDEEEDEDEEDPDPEREDPLWEDLAAQYAAKHGLIALLAPLIRAALHELHPRRVSASQWVEGVVPDEGGARGVGGGGKGKGEGQGKPSLRSAPPPPLPPLASLLLLSSFLASHLPPKTDTRFFLRDSSLLPSAHGGVSRRRKRKRAANAQNGRDFDDEDDAGPQRRANAHPLLLGPRPFPVKRMMYIAQNLAVEFGVRLPGEPQESEVSMSREHAASAGVHSLAVHRALAKLVQAGHIVFLSPPVTAGESVPAVPTRLDYLNAASMRCNLLREEVRSLILGCASSSESGAESEFGADPEDKYGAGAGAGAGIRARKDWWERVEECGL